MNIKWPWKRAVIVGGISEVRVPEVDTSDLSRAEKYCSDGGFFVDLTNKPRVPDDGFPPDEDLLQPFNQAHTGTREGLIIIAKDWKK